MNHAAPVHHEWTRANRELPGRQAVLSPLLRLHRTSDVNDLTVEQVEDARWVLRTRQAVLDADPEALREPTSPEVAEMYAWQRRIVERFLAGRAAYYGAADTEPLSDAARYADEGRDVFVVIKFMDEAPHLGHTLRSLFNQHRVDQSRVVVIAVDNNSTDGSERIVRDAITANKGPLRLVYLNQHRPGAGHAARLGVDRAIATVYAMCEHLGRWDLLQRAVIGVSDGDTVYAPELLHSNLTLFERYPDTDGVMPFLTYKLVAALRLFEGYARAVPEEMRDAADLDRAVPVTADLSDPAAMTAWPLAGRRLDGATIVLAGRDGSTLSVPLAFADLAGRRFGVLRDETGRLAYVLADRRIVLDDAPVSGFDEPLVMLDNGAVRPEQKWRWHALVGHDLFLGWAFAGMGLPTEVIYPDTSDALKMFRVWSFAIGGQHQLRRDDLRIATGSDYQSGRVLQVVGALTRLGPASAPAETEIDRLLKMVRNLTHRQGVFYGETRSAGLERATGLYLHMTRIQPELEAEVRRYDDEVFQYTVFPERILFPLRWLLQNAVRCYAQRDPRAAAMVRERVLGAIFTPAEAADVEQRWLDEATVAGIRGAEFHDRQDVAEQVAADIIAGHYPALMRFYVRTLRDFLTAHGLVPERFEWLLDGLAESRNAIMEPQPRVHPSVVWDGDEFQIDLARGQVVAMRPATT